MGIRRPKSQVRGGVALSSTVYIVQLLVIQLLDNHGSSIIPSCNSHGSLHKRNSACECDISRCHCSRYVDATRHVSRVVDDAK
jgi:hypothetical protein